MTSKGYMKAIVEYIEGGYFGDNDMFSHINKLERCGRDTTAISSANSTVFVMSAAIVERIKFSFDNIYSQMLKIGIRKYKNHTIYKSI